MASRNISNLYDFYLYIARKERNVFITPAQFNANMDAGQLDAVEEWFAGYGADQKLHDALRQFRVYYQFTSTFAGFVTFPSDYIHILGSPFTVTGSTVNPITFLNEDELPKAMLSQVRAISNSYPVAVDTAAGFSIYPQQTQIGFLWYLRRPAQPVFGYSQSGRAITYNSATSTQLEFSDVYVNHILALALRYVGVNIDDKGISDFATQYEAGTK